MRWLRISLTVFGPLAVLSGLAFLAFEQAPERELGWILLPLGCAALAFLGALAGGLLQADRRLTLHGLALLVMALALCAIALAVAWTLFA